MQLIRITDPSHPLFDAAWRIYEASFPLSERRSLSYHLQAMQEPEFHACAAVEEGAVRAIVFFWNTGEVCYLEHLAVDPAARGSGAGTKALTALIGRSELPLLLEIEQPVDDVTRRREHFYNRLGLTMQPYAHGAFSYQRKAVCPTLCIMAKPDITQAQYDHFFDFFCRRVLRFTDHPIGHQQ